MDFLRFPIYFLWFPTISYDFLWISYDFLWFPMYFLISRQFQEVVQSFKRSSRRSRNSYVFPMYSYDFLWFPMISYVFPRLNFFSLPRRRPKFSYDFLCISLIFEWHVESNEFLYISYVLLRFLMISYDFIWFPMISYVFPSFKTASRVSSFEFALSGSGYSSIHKQCLD
jgi:hypothetical protein